LSNYQAAARCYRKAIDLDPSLAAAHYNLGELYRAQGHFASALSSYRKAIDLQPDFYQAFNGMGDAHRMQGNRRAAMDAYQSAIKVNPKCVKSYRFLAVVRKFSKKDPYLAGMASLLDHGDLNSSDRVLLNFSLGKAYEDLKQYETAFAYIAEGNRLQRARFSYDPTNNENLFANIKKAFCGPFGATRQHGKQDDPRPIFILGMPRSGTSLVEQILASHPDVYGAGELTTLDQVITTYAKKVFNQPYPQFVSHLTDRDCRNMGTAYIQMIRNHDRHQAFVTDKMPHNFLFVGMIAMILPHARIVHCVRHPMDTCLSIFKNHFSRQHAYAYDQRELGHYYRLYKDLMDHWREVMPNVVHDIHYEKLVREPEKQVRRLLSVCQLRWHDQCLAFHRSQRPVLTASTSQARRPLYRDSVALWEKYAQQLGPLKKEIADS
jgi:tetratricopeptide (TPR) repeat protein